jgi:hypothetical protein
MFGSVFDVRCAPFEPEHARLRAKRFGEVSPVRPQPRTD